MATFRKPRTPPFPSETKFWEQMHLEISQYVDKSFTWDVVPREPIEFAPGVKATAAWLQDIGVQESFVVETCVKHGYTDTTFFVGVKEADLLAIGLLDTLTGLSPLTFLLFFCNKNSLVFVRLLLSAGRASCSKILEAADRLPKNDIPDSIPATLDDWLRNINIECYAPNFSRAGYLQSDLRFMESFEVCCEKVFLSVLRG